MIVAYVSGHGFGHATRTAEALAAIRRRAPSARIAVVTSAPEFLLAPCAPDLFRSRRCDVGLAQRDALVIDEDATLREWAAFMEGWSDVVEAERRFLRECGARVVLGDIPPLAFEAAAAARVPSVALGNFGWDWIYAHYARRRREFQAPSQWAVAAYGRADLLARLPFAPHMTAFREVEDVPLILRRPSRPRDALRTALELDDRPAVLFSFGGVGLAFDAQRLRHLTDYQFLLAEGGGAMPPNARVVDGAALRRLRWSYIDAVGAADVVVTKPGYGIVSDAIGARTRLVYTDRGDFPEYDIFVSEMPRHLPCVHIERGALLRADLDEALDRVLAMNWPAELPRVDGAEAVARLVLDAAGRATANP